MQSVSASAEDCLQIATDIEQSVFARAIWIGAGLRGDALQRADISRLLGQETDFLVWDLFSGLCPDTLSASLGCLRAGGRLLILRPDTTHEDPSAERFSVYGQPARNHYRARFERLLAHYTPPTPCASTPLWQPCGQSAEQALTRLQQLDRQSHFVLRLDGLRGRGKTTLVERWLRQRDSRDTLVTGPTRASVARWQAIAGIRYGAPDQLAAEPRKASTLCIEEAGSLHLHLLQQLLKHYPKVLLVGTDEGYEGGGRGLALRLSKLQPHALEHITLTEPWRWAANDPLEAWSRRLFLAEDTTTTPAALNWGHGCAQVPASWLIDEARLSALFSLLRAAHYQTRPQDLRALLDGPNLHLYYRAENGRLVAVLLSALEGPLDRALLHDVSAKKRRPRGHLLPQILTLHRQQADLACQASMARVVRIAVLPAQLRSGHGSALLNYWREHCYRQAVALCGAVFAADPQTLGFWRRNQFHPVHWGYKREVCSGLRSVTVVDTQRNAQISPCDAPT